MATASKLAWALAMALMLSGCGVFEDEEHLCEIYNACKANCYWHNTCDD